MRQSLCWAYNNWTTPLTHLWRFLYPNCPRWVDIYISQMRQSLCWAYSYWNTPMPQVSRFLYPNYRHWVDIYITDVSVFMLSIQLLEHTYAPGMEIPIPELPSLGRHIYHRCVSLYAEHTIIGTHLCPTYGNFYTRITVIGSTYISHMRQLLCWAYNYWKTPMSQLWRFLYPKYRHWVDIYITDKSVSLLSMQFLEHTYAPGMEIPIPELPSLCRHIYHRWVSLNAEHTIIGTHLCPRYEDSYTQITVIGSTYISQMRQSLCWTYNYWNTPMPQVWRFLYPNYRHCVDINITDASVSTLSIQLLKNSYVTGMEIPISKLPLLGRHIYITDASVSILSMQLLGHTYVLGMEILIPEVPPLGRHIYHSCASLYAEHTIIERHLCLSYEDSYTRNTVIGSKYISQMSQSLCWAYKY